LSLRDVKALAGLLVAGSAIAGFHVLGRAYDGWRVPQGFGMTHLLPEEVRLLAVFLALGTVALVGLATALLHTRVPDAGLALGRAASRRLPLVAAGAALAVLVGGVFVGTALLRDTVVTDDESAYRLIARTLRLGKLVAPSPGTDLEFFREQFVVLTPDRRYAKYPIGHPALLAAGQVVGAERLVVPIVSALTAFPLVLLARHIYGPGVAVAAAALFASSPQVVLTAGTLLSQPLSMLLATAATFFLLSERGTRGLLPAGVLLGFALHVRPLPGALFAVVAVVWLLVTRREPWPRLLLYFGGPVAVGAAGLLVVNAAQAGGPLNSGYQDFHGTGGGAGGIGALLGGSSWMVAMSLAAAAARLLAWHTGWPFAPLAAASAPPASGRGLVVGMVGAEIAYRVISPKAGVGITGPVYMLEAVPFFCLLGAGGLLALARRRGGGERTAASVVLAGAVVNAAMFVPVQIDTISRSAAAHRVLPRLLRQAGVSRAVVFHNGAVPLGAGWSWAYYPPFNGPLLDDDVLHLWMPDPSLAPAAREVWQRRFPDRPAFWFTYEPQGPRLLQLEAR
jgi:hypothetical protein